MKIGYVLFNNPVELSYEHATVLGSDIRLGVLESMVKQGHHVTILSPIKASSRSWNHEAMLDPNSKEREWASFNSHINYSFLDNVAYEPLEDKNLDLDALFIQYGPTNTLFAYNAPNESYRAIYGNRTPYMHRTMAIVENFHGPIIYYQNDDLPIPLGEVDYGLPLHEVSVTNLRNVMGRWHPFEGDRKWMILTTGPQINVFKKENSSRRYMYHEKPFQFKFIPVAYSANVFPYYPPMEDTAFDLLYLGAQGDAHRNKRLADLMGYYGTTHRKGIVGNWEADKKGNDPKSHFKGTDVEFFPPVSQFQVCDTLNTAMCSIQVLKKRFHIFGMMSMRAIEVIRSGAILLVDSTIPGYRHYVEDDNGVFNKTQVAERVQRVKDMPYEDRVELSMAQNEKLLAWEDVRWERMFSEVNGDVCDVCDNAGCPTCQGAL